MYRRKTAKPKEGTPADADPAISPRGLFLCLLSLPPAHRFPGAGAGTALLTTHPPEP